MRNHNLATVIRFEVVRTLRKPIFWVITLGVPLLFVTLAGLSAFSSISGGTAIEDASKNTKEFVYHDASGLISPTVAKQLGGTVTTDVDAAKEAVQRGSGPVLVTVPKDPLKEPITIYGPDLGLLANNGYSDVANQLVAKSVAVKVGSATLVKLAQGQGDVTVHTYADGVETQGVRAFLPPLAFLVLFFMSVTMLGNQMLNITVEEKENRVTEMVLTTVGPTTLITGKVIAVTIVGLVQAAVFAVPGLIAAAVAATALRGAVVLDPTRMLLGFALFVAGFLLFTGLLICIGSVMPSAKDAGGAFGAVVMLMFLPLYLATLLLSDPTGAAAQVLTFFPLTAPITALLRNAAGSLPLWQGLVVLLILLGCAAGFFSLGAKLFRAGSLSYDRRLNPFTALSRRRVARSPSSS